MSKPEVERFAADLRSDESLRREIDRITTDPLAAVVGIAQRRGYSFTLDEAKDFVRAKARAAGKSLSDRELDHVAGGTNPIDAIGNAGKTIGSGLESAGKTIASWF
jgi:predicted ribosomally synthesized peptide with nif11-like leader